MALTMLVVPSAERAMSLETQLPYDVCRVLLHERQDYKRLSRVIETNLMTMKHRKVLEELGITVEQIVQDWYTKPEVKQLQPVFDDWNATVKQKLFHSYFAIDCKTTLAPAKSLR